MPSYREAFPRSSGRAGRWDCRSTCRSRRTPGARPARASSRARSGCSRPTGRARALPSEYPRRRICRKYFELRYQLLKALLDDRFRLHRSWAAPQRPPAPGRRPSPAPLHIGNPRATSLYQLLDTHFETIKRLWEERFECRYGFWQAYWDSAVFSYLDCALFESGLARVVCPECRYEFLVAFFRPGNAFGHLRRRLSSPESLRDGGCLSVPHSPKTGPSSMETRGRLSLPRSLSS